jgi:hypothetical protein
VTAEKALLGVAGEGTVISWFGRMPRFHDAELREIVLSSNGPNLLRILAWNMTDKTDEKGYFILEKHAVVTITLDAVTAVNLSDFNLPGIILDMAVSRLGDEFELAWTGSYGVEGAIRAKNLSFALEPGKIETTPWSLNP